MPDISMCPGGNCPRKAECYRFTAKPTPGRQAYFVTPPFDNAKGDCLYHLPIYDKSPSQCLPKGVPDAK